MMDFVSKARIAAASLLVIAVLSTPARAGILGAPIIVAETGEVVATFQGNFAQHSSDLYLDSPANSLGIIFNNHTTPVGTSMSLGSFTAGTELVFRLHVIPTEDDFYTGAASRNEDGIFHAEVTDNWKPGETLVGFEDIYGGGDFDYNDLLFSFTNTGTTDPNAIPEPGTLALPGSVLLPFATRRYRLRG